MSWPLVSIIVLLLFCIGYCIIAYRETLVAAEKIIKFFGDDPFELWHWESEIERNCGIWSKSALEKLFFEGKLERMQGVTLGGNIISRYRIKT